MNVINNDRIANKLLESSSKTPDDVSKSDQETKHTTLITKKLSKEEISTSIIPELNDEKDEEVLDLKVQDNNKNQFTIINHRPSGQNLHSSQGRYTTPINDNKGVHINTSQKENKLKQQDQNYSRVTPIFKVNVPNLSKVPDSKPENSRSQK